MREVLSSAVCPTDFTDNLRVKKTIPKAKSVTRLQIFVVNRESVGTDKMSAIVHSCLPRLRHVMAAVIINETKRTLKRRTADDTRGRPAMRLPHPT